jgi:hypothetical protein
MEQQPPTHEAAPEPTPALPERRTISARKLAANRRNAQLSTGPRTAHGKARSSMNAIKHGILSHQFVIGQLETNGAAYEFSNLMRALRDDLRPSGALEDLMVQEIGVCVWRMRRVLRYENRVAFQTARLWQEPRVLTRLAASIVDPMAMLHTRETEKTLAETGLNELSLPDEAQVQTITRYESTLMRHLFRTMERLERMQSRRRVAAAEGDGQARANGARRTHGDGRIRKDFRG